MSELWTKSVVILAAAAFFVGTAALAEDKSVTAISAAATSTLTLDQAIATAVDNSPGLSVARARTERSRNQVREARSRSNFNLGVNAGYTHMSKPPTPLMKEDQTTVSGTVSLPIDLSRRISLGTQLAKLQLNIQEFSEVQTLQQLIADVKNAYYNVLRAESGVKVAQDAVTAAEERLRISRAQYEAGVLPKFDVTQAEVDVANLKQSVIQAQNGTLLAKAALNQTIGVNPNDPVDVIEQPADIAPVTIDIPAKTKEAFATRPEIQQALWGVDLAKRNVKFVGTEDDPTIAAFAGPNWSSAATSGAGSQTSFTYGINITWPLWQGGAVKARTAAAKNDVVAAERALDQALLGVTLDVRSAALNVMEASTRVQSAEANVLLAEEALRLARVRYQEGVSTIVEVTNAEAALTQARTISVNARYDYLNAVAQLDRATASQPEYAEIAEITPIMAPESVVDRY